MLHKSTLRLTPEVVAASKQYRQGDIVHGALFTYAARFDHGITELTRSLGNENAIAGVSTHTSAIIVSQTCDLQEDKRIAIQPFVSAARVFDAATELHLLCWVIYAVNASAISSL